MGKTCVLSVKYPSTGRPSVRTSLPGHVHRSTGTATRSFSRMHQLTAGCRSGPIVRCAESVELAVPDWDGVIAFAQRGFQTGELGASCREPGAQRGHYAAFAAKCGTDVKGDCVQRSTGRICTVHLCVGEYCSGHSAASRFPRLFALRRINHRRRVAPHPSSRPPRRRQNRSAATPDLQNSHLRQRPYRANSL